MKTNQKFPKASKLRMSLTKHRRWAESLDWTLAVPYWDKKLELGTRNRKLKFLTLRQFKQLVDTGKGIPQLTQAGYSKHLLNFFSRFLRGAFSLSCEQFQEEYITRGKSLDEIAKTYNMERGQLTFLRELYEVKNTGPTYIHRKATEKPITLFQAEFLVACMLGDSGRFGQGRAVKFKHGLPQEAYIRWKYGVLEGISRSPMYRETHYDARYDKTNTSVCFYTHANSSVEEIISLFHPNNQRTKIVTPKVLDYLSPFGLAVWYQDDGMSGFCMHNHKSLSMDIKLCTECFSKEENVLIAEWMKSKYGLNAVLRKYRNGRYRIRIPEADSFRFVELVRPHMVPSMLYKVDKSVAYQYYVPAPRVPELQDIASSPRGKEFEALPLEDQDAVVGAVVEYYQNQPFHRHLPKPDQHVRDIGKILSYDTKTLWKDDILKYSYAGYRFMLSCFPNFWSAKAKGSISVKEIFENKSYMCEIIRGLLIDDRKPIPKAVLSSARRYRGNKSISIFMPCMAKGIYDRLAPPGSDVLDLCGGYGARLIGSLASDNVKSYTGIEPSLKTYHSLLYLKNMMKKYGVNKPVSLCRSDALRVVGDFAVDQFDFCFTSVPYFDAEEYSEEHSQSRNAYPSYGQWLDSFLFSLIRQAVRCSKRTVINVANTGSYKIADDLQSWLNKQSMPFSKYSIEFPYFGSKRTESLFIMPN